MSTQATLPKLTAPGANLSAIHLAPVTDWSAMGASEHFVQFYEDETFLQESIAGFLAAGLRQGEATILIATKPHRRAKIGRAHV